MGPKRLCGVLAALALALAACGSSEEPAGDPAAAQPPGGDPGAAHIHGLGVNPADGSVMIATHYGLFRAADGDARARRVGDRRQDTMGFTVVGPDRFLGSGHPDLRDDLPPLLGLIRSADGGRTWTPVSLLGDADFHVLRAAGSRVYGVNATDGAFMASADGGRTWKRRATPAGVFDLAVDPADGKRVVAATEGGLFVSPDGGAGWRPLANDRAGLLAWTADALVLVDADGAVHRSADGGASFEELGRVPGQPAAVAAHERDLLVALHDTTVHRSGDGGRTWELRVRAD